MSQEHGPLQPGDEILKLRVIREIGRGASAWVYHVRNEFTGCDYALKLIPNRHGSEFKQRARDEFRLLNSMNHPNVVRVVGANLTDDEAYVYILMELLKGYQLRDILEALRFLTIPEMLSVGAQLCDGVHDAHRLGTVHRDIKPENVFLCPQNHVKMLDFGVARHLAEEAEATGKKRWHGTPAYMPREQLMRDAITARSDVFAIAAVLYEAVAGLNHWQVVKRGASVSDIVQLLLSEDPSSDPPPLAELVDGFPRRISGIIAKAMARDAARRYASAYELGMALREASAEFEESARTANRHPRVRDLVAETHRARKAGVAGRARPADATRMSLTGTLEGDVLSVFQKPTVRSLQPPPFALPAAAEVPASVPLGRIPVKQHVALQKPERPVKTSPQRVSVAAPPMTHPSQRRDASDARPRPTQSQVPGPMHSNPPERPLWRTALSAVALAAVVATPLGAYIGGAVAAGRKDVVAAAPAPERLPAAAVTTAQRADSPTTGQSPPVAARTALERPVVALPAQASLPAKVAPVSQPQQPAARRPGPAALPFQTMSVAPIKPSRQVAPPKPSRQAVQDPERQLIY